jgi:hypothetical protein
VVAVGPFSCHPARHLDGMRHRLARVPLVGVVAAHSSEQLLMLRASGVEQLLGGRARGGVVALGLGGRGGRSGRCELVADDCSGRRISVAGEVGDGAPGAAGTVAGALVSCLGVCVWCALASGTAPSSVSTDSAVSALGALGCASAPRAVVPWGAASPGGPCSCSVRGYASTSGVPAGQIGSRSSYSLRNQSRSTPSLSHHRSKLRRISWRWNSLRSWDWRDALPATWSAVQASPPSAVTMQ